MLRRYCLAGALLLLTCGTSEADVIYTNSSAEIDAQNSFTETTVNNTFSVELLARMIGGPLLYDHTFNVPFADPLVQTGIANAESALSGAGAASFMGPSLISNSTSTNTVTSTNTFTSTADQSATKTFFGDDNVFSYGNWGICQNYTLDATGYPTVSNCTGGSLSQIFLNAGGFFSDPTDAVDTFDLLHVTRTVETVISETFLTRQVYEIDGVVAAPARVPEPASWQLMLVGLSVLGAWRIRANRGARLS